MKMKLLLFSVLSISSQARQLAVQRFIEEPRSVSVRSGETVVLACSVDNKMGVLQWTKGAFFIYHFTKQPESLLSFSFFKIWL